MAHRKTRIGLVESLEPRRLLSQILWTNQGSTSSDIDGFNSVFGSNATTARNVVASAVTMWAKIISNFNYSGGGNTYSITITMFPPSMTRV